MNIIYHCGGVNNEPNPEVINGRYIPEPIDLEGFLESEVSGIISVNGVKLVGITEGSSIGQWERYSGFSETEINQIKTLFLNLKNNPNPIISAAAAAVISSITKKGRKEIAQTLASAANNTNLSNSDRAIAIAFLGILLVGEFG